jgi:hypothetical protein
MVARVMLGQNSLHEKCLEWISPNFLAMSKSGLLSSPRSGKHPLIVDFQTATIWNASVNVCQVEKNAEKAIAMLKRNHGRSEKIVEQLLEEAKAQKPVTNSKNFITW